MLWSDRFRNRWITWDNFIAHNSFIFTVVRPGEASAMQEVWTGVVPPEQPFFLSFFKWEEHIFKEGPRLGIFLKMSDDVSKASDVFLKMPKDCTMHLVYSWRRPKYADATCIFLKTFTLTVFKYRKVYYSRYQKTSKVWTADRYMPQVQLVNSSRYQKIALCNLYTPQDI